MGGEATNESMTGRGSRGKIDGGKKKKITEISVGVGCVLGGWGCWFWGGA